MPPRPDYAALTRGQIAVFDRLNAGETGLPVVQRIVRLAEEVLRGLGAGFVEYSSGHGRVVAASGAYAPAVGRRVDGDALDEVFGDPQRVLGARCRAGET